MSRDPAARSRPVPQSDRSIPPVINPLQRLIQDRMRERAWSYADVARQGQMPRSTVHQLATAPQAPQRLPLPATLEALARGLDLPLDLVREVAAQAAGLQLYREEGRDPDTAVLIASMEQLTPEDRQQVVALVQSLLARSQQR